MIIQGDCLEVMKTFPDKSFDLVVTSPPYNKGKSKYGRWHKGNGIQYYSYEDNMNFEDYVSWQISIIKESLRVLKDRGSLFYNHKHILKENTVRFQYDWLKEFNITQIITWKHNSIVNINPIRFMGNTEQIYWISKSNKNIKFNSDCFSYGEVWEIPFDNKNEHPAPFPVEIPKRCIMACTNDGDSVLDPFMGSGTTGVACALMNREFTGIELDKGYCEIAERRIKHALSQGKLFNYNLET